MMGQEQTWGFAESKTKHQTSLRDHFRSLVKYGPAEELKRTSAADPEWLNQWIEKNGPYMMHQTTSPEALTAIQRDGILPRDLDHDDNRWGADCVASREGHTYLRHPYSTANDAVGIPKEDSDVVIDLRKLDPNRFVADEDSHTGYFRDRDGPYPKAEIARKPDAEGSGQVIHEPETGQWFPSFGHWADHHGLDEPADVAHSLNKMGTMAYRGSIHPSAFVPFPAQYADEDHLNSNYEAWKRIPHTAQEKFSAAKTETTLADHEAAKAAQPVPQGLQKGAAASPEWLKHWIDTQGPYLQHNTTAEARPHIMKDGLIPHDQGPGAKYDGYLIPRQNAVYLRTHPGSRYEKVDPLRPSIYADLRKLDPNKFIEDEDRMGESFRKVDPWTGHEIYEHPKEIYIPSVGSGRRMKYIHSVGKDGKVYKHWGHWADTHEDGEKDTPNRVAQSIRNGTIAYRGIIPPEALISGEDFKRLDLPGSRPFDTHNANQVDFLKKNPERIKFDPGHGEYSHEDKDVRDGSSFMYLPDEDRLHIHTGQESPYPATHPGSGRMTSQGDNTPGTMKFWNQPGSPGALIESQTQRAVQLFRDYNGNQEIKQSHSPYLNAVPHAMFSSREYLPTIQPLAPTWNL